jgi:hypothetical protein
VTTNTDEVETGFKMVQNYLCNPYFDTEKTLAKFRVDQLRNLGREISSTTKFAREQTKAKFGEHQWIDYIDSAAVAAVDMDFVRNVYDRSFGNPAEMTVFICSDLDKEMISGLVEKHLASISDKASLLSRTNPKGLREIILASDGSVGYALGMLESDSFEEKEKEREEILTLLSLLPKRTPYSKLYSYLITLPQKRDEIRCILELAERALGDLLTMNYSEDKERSFFLSGEEAEPFSQIGAKRCAAILSLIDGAISDLDKNALVPTLISDLAVKIHEA